MKHIRKWICLLLAVFAVSGTVVGNIAVQQQRALAQKVVRLHVRANSDSERDQAVKLRVRDSVLQQVQHLTAQCVSSDEALGVLADNLAVLAQTAADTLYKEGRNEAVTVSLCREEFPTRVYDTFSLPAGNYTALRVDIGQAAGHNWWCVVFPTLCMSATTEGMEQTAAAAGFSEQELTLITEQAPQVTVKFRLLEWLAGLESLFSAK